MPIRCIWEKSVASHVCLMLYYRFKSEVINCRKKFGLPLLPASRFVLSSAWILDHVSSIVMKLPTSVADWCREEEWRKLPLEARTLHLHSVKEPVFWRMSSQPVSPYVKAGEKPSMWCVSIQKWSVQLVATSSDGRVWYLTSSIIILQYNSKTTIVINIIISSYEGKLILDYATIQRNYRSEEVWSHQSQHRSDTHQEKARFETNNACTKVLNESQVEASAAKKKGKQSRKEFLAQSNNRRQSSAWKFFFLSSQSICSKSALQSAPISVKPKKVLSLIFFLL